VSAPEHTIEIRVIAQRRWQRVVAEDQGRDVSHLSFAPMPVRVGPAGQLHMAGIAGVATEPEYRRLGLASRVFDRAMQEIKAAGYSCVGLYTATDIVAHRLYRRFGFVDVMRHEGALKLLHPGQFVQERIAGLVQGEQGEGGLADWKCRLGIELRRYQPVYLRVDRGEVALLEAASPDLDLALKTTAGAFARLFWEADTIDHLEAAKALQWEGEEAHWQRFAGALRRRHRVIKEGEM